MRPSQASRIASLPRGKIRTKYVYSVYVNVQSSRLVLSSDLAAIRQGAITVLLLETLRLEDEGSELYLGSYFALPVKTVIHQIVDRTLLSIQSGETCIHLLSFSHFHSNTVNLEPAGRSVCYTIGPQRLSGASCRLFAGIGKNNITKSCDTCSRTQRFSF
ncbi:hypothetical protein BDV96DRAFT_34595 [Lophiotrema nucula]|uniref:Uncharacterized protein n=1 Tax=Lophiotrema nucula TaxID=690887 RepID=A0A6A5ZB78_9PLEO|nr:hypothetical protein BDV96DRAFT_34595 [Lophiotrema nucula]